MFIFVADKQSRMKKKHSQTTHSMERKDVVDVFKQMLTDKKAVQAYICEHGTLKGFKDESILFAKPL